MARTYGCNIDLTQPSGTRVHATGRGSSKRVAMQRAIENLLKHDPTANLWTDARIETWLVL